MIELEKKTPKEKVVQWYQTLDPSKRKQLTLFGGGGLLFLLAAIMINLSSEDNVKPFMNKPRKVEYTLFTGKSPKDVSIDAMAGKLNKLTSDFTEIRSTFQLQDQLIHEATQQMRQQSDELRKSNEKLTTQTKDLYQKLQEAQNTFKTQVPLPELPDDGVGDGRTKRGHSRQGSNPQRQTTPELLGQQPMSSPPALTEGEKKPVEAGLKIRIITGSSDDNKTSGKADANKAKTANKITEYVNIKTASSKNGIPDMYLPAGSILSGTLITGLDAPTSNQSRQDPYPALLRIKHEAILPNRYRMDIRECFLIAGGFGDMSSERAYMRAERISCIKKDGSIIEASMDAYSVGEDGKAGIRGRLVSKNGQLIGNALMSGFVAGVTNAFAPQRVQSLQTGVTPGSVQPYQYPSMEMIGGQSVAGGVKGAATVIAEYYLQMARNIFPIIEIDAGRKVDFIMIRGLSLQPKSKSNQGNNAAFNGNNGQTLSGTRGIGMGGASRGMSSLGTMGGMSSMSGMSSLYSGMNNNQGFSSFNNSSGFGP